MPASTAGVAHGIQILFNGQCIRDQNTGKLSRPMPFIAMTEMKKFIIAALFLPSIALADTAVLTPEATAALNFNQWYISQIMNGKEPLSDYASLNSYVTSDTIGKLKALGKLDPNENDAPDADMFIKAQGYQNDWNRVTVVGTDFDAACMQVYVAFGMNKKHVVIDCMVKEDGAWKVQSVAARNLN
ncbi:DUF3828 domain-containing protein [Lelliottia sp. CFBP8978]|nr:DUF3828 domain-containing protein [Lelliottia sp. CFBP8978]